MRTSPLYSAFSIAHPNASRDGLPGKPQDTASIRNIIVSSDQAWSGFICWSASEAVFTAYKYPSKAPQFLGLLVSTGVMGGMPRIQWVCGASAAPISFAAKFVRGRHKSCVGWLFSKAVAETFGH